MKSIGIVTLDDRFLLGNYGTFFQHLSLRRFVEGLGCRCGRILRKNDSPSIPVTVFRIVKRLLSIPWHVLRMGAGISEEVRIQTCCARQMALFRRDYWRLLGGSGQEVDVDKCDGIVIGGDQVWNDADDLVFGIGHGEGCKVVCYAASADWLQVSGDAVWLDKARRELLGFEAISVREDAGVKFLDGEIGFPKEIVRVCDPVFLNDKWFYFNLVPNKKILKKPTLLCYILNIREPADFSMECYRSIADSLGVDLKIVGIQGAERYLKMRDRQIPSPCDYIRMFRDAEYVITNSFHGVCFSLLFGRQFVCLKQREIPNSSQNVRSRELLGRLDLESRICDVDCQKESLIALLKAKIDFGCVDIALGEERKFSAEWLRRALQ